MADKTFHFRFTGEHDWLVICVRTWPFRPRLDVLVGIVDGRTVFTTRPCAPWHAGKLAYAT